MDFFCSQFGSQSSQFIGQTSASAPLPVHKVVNKRRSWSLLEEKVLIGAFAEIMAQGWKTPNGFRNGFLIQLEQKLKLSLPNTDLRGEPHISSKYGSWKKTYRDVAQVFGNSGFNWNAGTKIVDAFPQVWDAFQQAHPTLAYVREKPFPFYEVWVNIYGKDRATGNGSMDFHGAAVEQIPTENADEEESESAPNAVDGAHDPETAQSEKSTSPPGSTSRKRKRVEQPEEIIELISGMWSKATDSIREVAAAVKATQERENSCNRQQLYELIGKLPMVIPMYEQLEAAYEIAMSPFAMTLVISLPDDAKCEVVQRAVAGRLKRQVN